MNTSLQDHTNDLPEENTAFTVLPDYYRKNAFDFNLIKREGGVAIFAQTDNDIFIGYEVFEIRKQRANEFQGRQYEAKERVPSNEEWGTNAYSVRTFERAQERMKDILQTIQNRQINGADNQTR